MLAGRRSGAPGPVRRRRRRGLEAAVRGAPRRSSTCSASTAPWSRSPSATWWTPRRLEVAERGGRANGSRGTALEGAPVVACSVARPARASTDLARRARRDGGRPPPGARGGRRPAVRRPRVHDRGGGHRGDRHARPAAPRRRRRGRGAARRGSARAIRGLQTHKRADRAARPVSRVAVNLAGTERRRLERGDVLAPARQWRPTTTFEARIRPVRGLSHPSRRAGARSSSTRARPSATRRSASTATGSLPPTARSRASGSRPRSCSTSTTGSSSASPAGARRSRAAIVLDPAPPRTSRRGRRGALARREGASAEELPSLVLAERGAVRDERPPRRSPGLAAVEGREPAGGWWIDRPGPRSVGAARGVNGCASFHAAAPGRGGRRRRRRPLGRPSTRCAGSAPRPTATWRDPARRSRAERRGSCGAGRRSASPRTGAAWREPRSTASSAPSRRPSRRPPTIAELVRAGFAREVIDAAIRAGALVRVAPDLVLTPGLVARAIDAVREAGAAGVTVSAIRQRLGTSRRVRRAPPGAPRPDGRDAPERRPPVRPRNLVRGARGASAAAQRSATSRSARPRRGRRAASSPTPTAIRACRPSSPKISTSTSLAPFATFG